jgi:hypothetical protein
MPDKDLKVADWWGAEVREWAEMHVSRGGISEADIERLAILLGPKDRRMRIVGERVSAESPRCAQSCH